MNGIWMALLGGIFIALSSSVNYVLFGKITGLSGYLFTVFSGSPKELFVDRLCFLVGLVSVVDWYYFAYGTKIWGEPVIASEASVNVAIMALGGWLVGVGVRWGGGCTSGHGVCGIPRLSIRSLIAVPIFMLSGMITATLLSKLGPIFPEYTINLSQLDQYFLFKVLPKYLLFAGQALSIFLAIYTLIKGKNLVEKAKPLVFCVTGTLFGVGLLVSGMCNRTKILGFLTVGKDWDPSLLFVMASAVTINFFTFQGIMMWNRSVFDDHIDLPSKHLGVGVFAGPLLFGIGWGLTGLCPGPALANLTICGYAVPLILIIYAGQQLHDNLDYLSSSLNKKKVS